MQRKYKIKAAFRVISTYFISMGIVKLFELVIGIILSRYNAYNPQLLRSMMLPILPVLVIGIPLLIASISMETSFRNYKSYEAVKLELKSIEYTISGLLLVFMAANGLLFSLYNIGQYLPMVIHSESEALDIFFKQMIMNGVVGISSLLIQAAIGFVLFFKGKSKSNLQGDMEV